MAILTIDVNSHGLSFGIVELMAHLAFGVFSAFGEERDHLNGSHQFDFHEMTVSLEIFRFIC